MQTIDKIWRYTFELRKRNIFLLSCKPKCRSPCERNKMSLLRNYLDTIQTNTNKWNKHKQEQWCEVEEIECEHDSSGKLFAYSHFLFKNKTLYSSVINLLPNMWKRHAVHFNFRTWIFILLTANDQSGQVLPTMKEAGFGLVTQGVVNRNVGSISSIDKTSYKKYTSKGCCSQIAKYANETDCSDAVRKSIICFLTHSFPTDPFSTLIGNEWVYLNKSMVRRFQKKVSRPDETCWEKEQISGKADSQIAMWKATTSRQ